MKRAIGVVIFLLGMALLRLGYSGLVWGEVPVEKAGKTSTLVEKKVKLVAHIGTEKWTSDWRLSPNGERLAYWRRRAEVPAGQVKDSQVLMCDDKEGPKYDLGGGSVRFSADSKRLAYIGAHGDRQMVVLDGVEGAEAGQVAFEEFFSSDGKRFFYEAKEGEKEFVVVDGVKGKEYDEVKYPKFLGREEHFAYYAREGKKWRLVMDGVERAEAEYPSYMETSDGKRVAYVEKMGEGQERMVCDGKPGRVFERVLFPTFSPDGKRFAFEADVEDGANVMVCDEEAGGRYDSVAVPVFSPDSRRLAYWARVGEKQTVVCDGVRGKLYDRVDEICFSADGKRLAYSGVIGDKAMAVVDGQEGPKYDDVDHVFFSRDGKKVGYNANRGSEELVVWDGNEIRLMRDSWGCTCTPDGQHTMFWGQYGEKCRVKCEGMQGKEYAFVDYPAFSPDGRHVAYGVDKEWPPKRSRVVVDGIEGPQHEYVEVIEEGTKTPGRYRYIAVDKGEVWLMEVEWPKGIDWRNGMRAIEGGK